ncbi:hypothetical protein CC1G_07888 [Coprinopsis cinerea okayama7|uniref:F-box domain-containing protein n=1 Tax=Coprinopsis cinerea (strain Okayama-7 / 130 / ATCC MYA-4618 / FGSC 9003) TaxID=240176 RepID=A8P6K8_COPC7|nr:hypothetical protein CC1G_07888 [Coprinopsis cinerea okayama7\|eukprot:XP_001839173.2 hypothetical protein CC1G_07888 [Coprinopsis cinerea okayama7\
MTEPMAVVPESMTLEMDPNARRAWIDSRIAALEDEIRRWKSSRNELSVISRLPPEVLTRIFEAYKQMCDRYGRTGNTPQPRQHYIKLYQWTRVTHVSRYWREVALGCPYLWSDIRTVNHNWARTFLERSKQAPISLNATESLSVTNMEDFEDEILAQSHRLKSIRVYGGASFEKRVQELTNPTPLLQSLMITRGYQNQNAASPILPTEFLSGEAPKLQDLELDGYWLPWDSTVLFRGLTSLKLTFYPPSHTPPPSPETFFDVLEAMEGLQTLYLDIPLPISPLAKHRTIALARMEKFTLKGFLSGCTNVMTHLALPPSSTLHIFAIQKEEDTAHSNVTMADLSISITNSWLSGHLGSNSTTPASAPSVLKSLELDTNDVLSNSVKGYLVDNDSPHRPGGCRNVPSLELRVAGDYSGAESADWLPDLLGGLPLNDSRLSRARD